MAERSMFWDSGVGDGGPYDDDELRILFKVLGAALGDNEGVVGGFLNSVRPTSPGDNQVRSDSGAAIVNGTLYDADASVTHSMSAPASGATGKRLVLRKSWAARTVRSAVISSADGTAALPSLTQVDGTTWEIPLASFTHQVSGAISGFVEEREFTRPLYIEISLEGGGAVLTADVKGYFEVPATMELVGWAMYGDQSGTVQVDLWKDTYANFPPTVADTVCGTSKPSLAAQQKNQDTDLSEWTSRKWLRGEVFAVNIDAAPAPAGVQRATLVLRGFRT